MSRSYVSRYGYAEPLPAGTSPADLERIEDVLAASTCGDAPAARRRGPVRYGGGLLGFEELSTVAKHSRIWHELELLAESRRLRESA